MNFWNNFSKLSSLNLFQPVFIWKNYILHLILFTHRTNWKYNFISFEKFNALHNFKSRNHYSIQSGKFPVCFQKVNKLSTICMQEQKSKTYYGGWAWQWFIVLIPVIFLWSHQKLYINMEMYKQNQIIRSLPLT